MNHEPRSAPPLAHCETDIEAALEPTPAGPLWVARATYPEAYRHGHMPVATGRAFAPSDLALVSREPRAQSVAPERWAVLDIESTGLGARAGTYAFLIGIGTWTESAFVVEQLLMRDPSDEPALLHALAARLERAGGLVTFNGKAFDLPLLATRSALARRASPHTALAHCDLLHAARRLWRSDAGDCRLAALEHRILGLRRAHDVGGRDVPDLYLDYLRDGAAAAIDVVLRHNRADIVSLALLTAAAARVPARARAEPEAGGDAALHRMRVARLYAEAGLQGDAAALFATCLAAEAAPVARQAARAWLARARLQAGDCNGACRLWQEMLEEDPDLLEPYTELAKTLEHRLRDPARALGWVEQRLAGARLAAPDAAQLAHRRARLARKLGGIPLLPVAPEPDAATTGGAASQPSLDGASRSLLPYCSP
jgi:uncharacterized protein YprB with RNaseH-like and TPR domain